MTVVAECPEAWVVPSMGVGAVCSEDQVVVWKEVMCVDIFPSYRWLATDHGPLPLTTDHRETGPPFLPL